MNIDTALQSAAGFFDDGQSNRAEALCKEILKIHPRNPGALFLMGLIYQERNNAEKAIPFYQSALLSDPALVSAYYNLGSIFQEQGRREDALRYYEEALERDPALADAWNAAGSIYYEKGEYDKAVICYRKAIESDPTLADAHYNMGKVLWDQGERDAALSYYRKALQLNPNSAEANNNLGYCLQEQGRYDEARSYFERALGLNPHFAEAYYNLALSYHDRNEVDEAIRYYRKAIEHKPGYTEAHFNMACALLLSGDFKEGWREYEWRWKLKNHRGHTFSHPRWEGSDISGRTILLHAEQGFGDAIQFIRYAPLVAERGAKVIVQCPEELVSLFRNVAGVADVFSDIENVPGFDLHCPFLSLPRVFGTTIETIPATIPYITTDPLSVQKWKDVLQRDGSPLRAGLVWTGRTGAKRERERSCSLGLFAPVARGIGITFYSLQKGEGAEQAKTPPPEMELLDYTEDIHDFSDTAALIANLDVVISVDTAVAHLAGALGKPVWTLLPFMPDWRWLLDTGKSPWYPTMKLFRQPAPGDWETAVENIGNEIKQGIVTGRIP